jgi:hypothetical protein
MLNVGIALIVIAGLLIVGNYWLKKRTEAKHGGAPEAIESSDGEATPSGSRAPVVDFHVSGNEAKVTFDVPLDDEDDEILNELLVDEAVEVVREKRHLLPIADVQEVVALAGRGNVREVGRTRLPSPGTLPPPPPVSLLNLGNVTRDPFTAENPTEHGVAYETKAAVPSDDLPPIGEELRIPKGLQRGLRATGVDIQTASGAEIIVGLLQLFGYNLDTSTGTGSYTAHKGGETTLIVVDPYQPGDDPQVGEEAVKVFTGRFSMSGANRGVFVSEKYAPYTIYDLERREPRIRFLTRERLQEFIDSMAIG